MGRPAPDFSRCHRGGKPGQAHFLRTRTRGARAERTRGLAPCGAEPHTAVPYRDRPSAWSSIRVHRGMSGPTSEPTRESPGLSGGGIGPSYTVPVAPPKSPDPLTCVPHTGSTMVAACSERRRAGADSRHTGAETWRHATYRVPLVPPRPGSRVSSPMPWIPPARWRAPDLPAFHKEATEARLQERGEPFFRLPCRLPRLALWDANAPAAGSYKGDPRRIDRRTGFLHPVEAEPTARHAMPAGSPWAR